MTGMFRRAREKKFTAGLASTEKDYFFGRRWRNLAIILDAPANGGDKKT
ncbi:hypothetical protein [Bradyrhizobium erythrophlei]|nr:hypothetical protein [Bradyrhizobium erythrophlei]